MASISLTNLIAKKLIPQFRPNVKSDDDTSNFLKADDSFTEAE